MKQLEQEILPKGRCETKRDYDGSQASRVDSSLVGYLLSVDEGVPGVCTLALWTGGAVSISVGRVGSFSTLTVGR